MSEDFIHDQVVAIWRLFPGTSLTPELREEIERILVYSMICAIVDSSVRENMGKHSKPGIYFM